MAHFGDRLKALRTRDALKQDDLAPHLNVTRAYISSVEKSGKGSPEFIEAVCKYFKVEKKWLLNGDGTEPKGIVIPIRTDISDGAWKDEAYNRMKAENERLWALVEKLTGAAVAKPAGNFPKASTLASALVVPINRKRALVGARA